MDKRYSRSLGVLTKQELEKLHSSKVCVVGCGGIGGYVIEELARIGVGALTLVDPDSFDETNLNRQLLCTEKLLGKGKALAAAERVKSINSGVNAFPAAEALTSENAEALLSGCDLAVDALDSANARIVLAAACSKLGIPLVHGAVNGFRAQVTVLSPGSDAFSYMYPAGYEDAKHTPSLPFTPALAASLEAAEAVKLLCGRESALSGRLLLADLGTMEFTTVKL